MKYPFRFTSTYIADLDQIVSAEVVCNQTEASLQYKNGDADTIDFDNKKQCLAVFERFCRTCKGYANEQQIERASK